MEIIYMKDWGVAGLNPALQPVPPTLGMELIWIQVDTHGEVYGEGGTNSKGATVDTFLEE